MQIKHNHVMKPGVRIHLPVSIAETKIIKRYSTIPTATLNPNADEIEYMRRLVIYKASFLFLFCPFLVEFLLEFFVSFLTFPGICYS